jgi:hypothetical protein
VNDAVIQNKLAHNTERPDGCLNCYVMENLSCKTTGKMVGQKMQNFLGNVKSEKIEHPKMSPSFDA